MNNIINEIKNSLEGTNSRIVQYYKVEDIMVEIKETERKKEKRMKKNEDNLRDFWDNVNAKYSNHRSPRRRREKERP